MKSHCLNSFIFIFYFLMSSSLYAQISNTATLDTSGGVTINKLTIGGYIDTYYGYAYNLPNRTQAVPFFVSSANQNEFAVNLAYLDLRLKTDRLRARIVPAFGSYMQSNYANEPAGLRNLLEASAGIKLFKKKEIWLDAGILGSPYTNESAISKDHLTYTRSLSAENVPYYLTGIRIGVPVSKKLNLNLFFVNGWQEIDDKNDGKSIGTQLEYRPNDKNLLNWDTYVGDEENLSHLDYRRRYFTDIYWLYSAKKVSISSCAYAGWQEMDTANGNSYYNFWWQANFILNYQLTKRTSVSGRFEYFNDVNQVLVSSLPLTDPFQTYGTSLCINVKSFEHALFRFETRQLFSSESVFIDNNNVPINYMFWTSANLTLWF